MNSEIRKQLQSLSDECASICRTAGWVGPAPDNIPNFRLLYSSVRTFESGNGLMILGINPGGAASNAEIAHHRSPFDDPHYCAYLDDSWLRSTTGEAPLQRAIRSIAKELFADDWEDYLRNAQSANVIPFRSRSSDILDYDLKDSGERIGRQTIALANPRPKVVITLAHQAWDLFIDATGYRSGFKGKETQTAPRLKRTMREAEISRGQFEGAYLIGLPAVVRDHDRRDALDPILRQLSLRRDRVRKLLAS